MRLLHHYNSVHIPFFRSQCASHNTARLAVFPTHPTLSCTKCKDRLRLWPDQGPEFVCDSPEGTCAQEASTRQRSVPSLINFSMFFCVRYACYLCDYNLCKLCVLTMEKESINQREPSPQLVSCLKAMCDEDEDCVR